jgi:RHH-type rel operon transcriptional repressor/antitoxin RelB
MESAMEKVTEKVTVTCRLSPEDVVFLDRLAEVTERDRSYLIKKAVADYIALQRWQIEEIEQALKEADADDFATDKEVRAVFNEFR